MQLSKCSSISAFEVSLYDANGETQHGRMVGNLARRHSRYEDVRPSKERVMPRQRSGTQIVWQGRFRKHLMHCYKGRADRLRILEAAISSTQARRRYLEGIYTQSPHNHYSCIFRRPAREKHLILQWFVSIILTNYWKTSINSQTLQTVLIAIMRSEVIYWEELTGFWTRCR